MWVALIQSVEHFKKNALPSEEENSQAVADYLDSSCQRSARSWVSSLQADSADWDLLASQFCEPII